MENKVEWLIVDLAEEIRLLDEKILKLKAKRKEKNNICDRLVNLKNKNK